MNIRKADALDALTLGFTVIDSQSNNKKPEKQEQEQGKEMNSSSKNSRCCDASGQIRDI
jgi:hypothetical protein